jgi:DNA-directed RNA polymerase specialized sigma24 family protein
VVILRFYLGYSHQEIAEALGITPNASEVRLCRALKQLRYALAAGHAGNSATGRSPDERLAEARAS